MLFSTNKEKLIICKSWFKEIKFDNGKPDTISIIILSNLIDSYNGDLIQKSYESIADNLGFTKRQVRDSVKRLEDLEIITRIFKSIKLDGYGAANNVLFIKLHQERIIEISY